MGQFGVMIGQLVGFLIMLMVGYGCVRLRFYGQTALDGMCSLLLNVLIPVLVFSNAVDGADRAQLAANWGVMLLTAVMYALLILVFWLVAKLLRLQGLTQPRVPGGADFRQRRIHRHSVDYGTLAAERRDLRGADVDHRPDAALDVRRMAVRAGRRNDWRQRDWRARCGRERFGERHRFGGGGCEQRFSGRRPPLARHPRPRPA